MELWHQQISYSCPESVSMTLYHYETGDVTPTNLDHFSGHYIVEL